MSSALKIIPLGGLGEIGLNSMALVYGDSMVLIDAGVMFPTAQMPGVDAVVPDFSFVIENLSKLKGVVLTHGHEDHVGALPWLLRHADVPIWGSPSGAARSRSASCARDLKSSVFAATFARWSRAAAFKSMTSSVSNRFG
jgi:mRNA degradation ribonuclease J1/J2